jgi:hypothetical protein
LLGDASQAQATTLRRKFDEQTEVAVANFVWSSLEQTREAIVTVLGNPKPIQEIRQQIIPLPPGTILEVGVAPGVNFAYYDPAKVDYPVTLVLGSRDHSGIGFKCVEPGGPFKAVHAA